MSLHTRKQLAELLNFDWNNKSNRDKIGMWIKRNNLIEIDGLIDDTNPQNNFWIKKQSSKPVKEVETNNTNQESVPIADHPNKTKKSTKSTGEGKELFELTKIKKELEIDKLQVDTRIQELREEKMRGEVIPIELIKNVFTQHTQSIVTEYKNSVENVLTIFSKRKSLSGSEAAEIRGELVLTINTAVDKAIEVSKKNIENIIKEFSVKKDVGQHD